MRVQVRALNKGERFPCSPGDIRRLFPERPHCLQVWFGHINRQHCFDGKDRSHPVIRGTVVAAASVNLRHFDGVGSQGGEGERNVFLNLYVLRDREFPETARRQFVDESLPQLRRWFDEVAAHPPHLCSGVECLLFEWYKGEIAEHAYRYH